MKGFCATFETRGDLHPPCNSMLCYIEDEAGKRTYLPFMFEQLFDSAEDFASALRDAADTIERVAKGAPPSQKEIEHMELMRDILQAP